MISIVATGLLTLALTQASATAPAAPAPTPAFDRTICDDPARRGEYLKTFDPEKDPMLADSLAATQRNTALMEAKLDKLAKAAKWSDEQKSNFALGMFGDPQLRQQMEEAMKVVTSMLEKLTALTEEKDEAKQCQIVADMFAVIPQARASGDAQWATMDRLIAAEAAKLGLALTD